MHDVHEEWVALWCEWQLGRTISQLKRSQSLDASQALDVGVRHDAALRRLLRAREWPQQPTNVIVRHQLPAPLRHTSDAPFGLCILGDPALLGDIPRVAIVGSRKPRSESSHFAQRLASELAQCGVVVVSGLAVGVDAAAHRGALDAGGSTIAVLGSGIECPYPASNRELAARIADSGLVVSEYAPTTPAHKAHFPQRNRIIAGLCDLVVVVQAGSKSGSMITATAALNAGVDVCVMPGSIADAQFAGSLALIRDGASVAVDAGSVLHILGLSAPDAGEYGLASILQVPRTADEIAGLSGLSAADTWVELLDLEVAGNVVRTADGRYVDAGFQRDGLRAPTMRINA